MRNVIPNIIIFIIYVDEPRKICYYLQILWKYLMFVITVAVPTLIFMFLIVMKYSRRKNKLATETETEYYQSDSYR